MANIILKIGKGLEVAATDVIKWAKEAEAYTAKVTPGSLAAFAVLMEGVIKFAGDVNTDVSNPLEILLGGKAQLQDFLALIPELKTLAESLGITKL